MGWNTSSLWSTDTDVRATLEDGEERAQRQARRRSRQHAHGYVAAVVALVLLDHHVVDAGRGVAT